MTSDGTLVVKVGARGYRLSPDSSAMVGRFLVPSTPAQARARDPDALPTARFDQLVAELERLGVLVRDEAPADDAVVELHAALAPAVLTHQAQLCTWIQRGRAVVIREAVQPSLAMRVQRELESVDTWSCTERLGTAPHFRHHTIDARASDLPALTWCRRLFESESSRALARDLCGQPCDGPIELGATRYLPGDFAMPHADAGRDRTLAFVWHLSTDWDPGWGGAFRWSPSGLELPPSFNTLILFRVGRETVHMVTPVSRFATGKRLSITGWWTRATPDPPPRQSPSQPPDQPGGAPYGAESVIIDEPAGIFIL